jgi:glycosyltransferase involved in cell wall biosynthesis
LIAQRWSGARLILDVDDDEADSHQFAHAWQRRLVAWGEQSIPRHASTITTASAWLRQRYGSNALHVPNGLEPAQFALASPSAQTALQQRYQLPSRYLLYFGNLATQSHGVDVLLQALAQSTTQLPLVIAGDGHERAALQQLAVQLGIARRCLWLGQIAPSDIPALLAQAHVSIDPVRATIAAAARFPLKICESLAQGVPVITSPVGDRATLVGEAGILVPAGDSQALATALTQISTQVFDAPHIQAQVRQLQWTQVAPRWLAHHRLGRDA